MLEYSSCKETSENFLNFDRSIDFAQVFPTDAYAELLVIIGNVLSIELNCYKRGLSIIPSFTFSVLVGKYDIALETVFVRNDLISFASI